MAQTHEHAPQGSAHAEGGEQHQPISVYLRVWGLLFLLSALSYLVDFFEVRPIPLKWALLTGFAVVKASLILAYFMHLRFERLSLVYAVLLPPLLLMALVGIVMPDGAYVSYVRDLLLGGGG